MRDILGQGGDGPSGPWPRRLAVIAVLLLAAVVIAVHLPRHHQAGRPARSAGTARPARRAAPDSGGAAAGPDGVAGQTLPWDGSLRLPVTGAQPAWFWPGTGRSRPIGGLPRDGSGYQFLALASGWAVQANPGSQPGQPGPVGQSGQSGQSGCGCAGPPRPVYFLGAGARSVSQIGVADEVAPAATPGAVWLTSYPPGADTSTAAGTAQEVAVTGTPIGPQVRLPAGYAIAQGTARGLLLAPVAQRTGVATYTLWEPAAAQAYRTFDGVIAANGNEIAWADGCVPLCQVQMLNLATGRRATVELPGASSAVNGAFSPDGELLALEVSLDNGGDDGALATQLDVASAATGRVSVVPDTFVSSDALDGFGWPAGGDSLIAELSFTTKVQVTSWYPGAAHLAVAAIRPGPSSTSLIVG
jgi:hypothetical protein